MKLLRAILRAALALALLVLGAGLLGSAAPLFDLANLAVPPFAVLGIACSLGLLCMVRRWWKKAGMIAAAIGCGAMLIPPAAPPATCAAGTARVRVAWFNAHGMEDPAPIMAWLERENPALVGFAEVSPGSHLVRAAVLARYPHMQSCSRNGYCSTLIYARAAPVAGAALARGDPENRKALSAAAMRFADFNVMAVHLSRPLPLGRQGEELAQLAGQLDGPADTVIMGDFNATRRMHVLRDFAARGGFGIGKADGPTWPQYWDGEQTMPLIQIDQVLVGRNWAITALRTSPDLGSDHRGLVADLCRRL